MDPREEREARSTRTGRSAPTRPQRRAQLLYWRERWLLAITFAGVLLVGLCVTGAPFGQRSVDSVDLGEALLIGALSAVVVALVAARFGRGISHAIANARAEKLHLVLTRPSVVDGDTIDDIATGIRYRFANIDAPETGDNARCWNEDQRGRLATLSVKSIVSRAKTVTVRRTARTDIYGRRVAFVYADGVDIGETLIQKGLARPWRGAREKWCGPNGGLAKIAKSGAMPISCKTCGAWSAR